jgi:dephospho-CoA kinase
MIVIGLTGGIGSGKSEVAQILRNLGAQIIDLDHVGHEAYLPHTKGWAAIIEAFGDGILEASGEINRKKLGRQVFADRNALKQLNEIVHPRMRAMIMERIQEHRDNKTEVVVVDGAILIETGWASLVDELWVVAASEKVIAQRLNERDGLSVAEVRKRIGAQISTEERKKHATVVIENNSSIKDLRHKVHDVWENRLRGRRF